jgi:DNA-directed RNA polymerase specialized sigma24 family protein
MKQLLSGTPSGTTSSVSFSISDADCVKAYRSGRLSVLSAMKYYQVSLDDDEVSDIVSDAVTRGLESYRPDRGASFPTFVSRLAWKGLIDYSNSPAFTRRVSVEHSLNYAKWRHLPEPGSDGVRQPDEILHWKRMLNSYDSFKEGCSELDRELLRLMEDDVPPREAAPVLGLTPNAVGSRKNRLRKRLLPIREAC